MILRRVACALSGGVDSCVAALLLKKRYNVIGVYMYNWDIADETGHCSSEDDAKDAQNICKRLSIPFHTVRFVKEYWNEVFVSMINDYENGLTPNPDVLCNKKVKFNAFFNYAINVLKTDAIATGHYARSSFGENLERSDLDHQAHLLRGVDRIKDQSLFLSQIPQLALRRTLFPLGNLTKKEVKQIAVDNGFADVAAKKESTGICFIGKRKFSDFINDYVQPKPGRFIDIESGSVVGHHNGIHMWTVGQCCKIAGKCVSYYVVEKDSFSQDIVVAPGNNHPSLFSTDFSTDIPYWIHSEPENLGRHGCMEAEFRFQHVSSSPVKCFLELSRHNKLHVRLSEPMRALTPGQYAVFYEKEKCLGSARIAKVELLDYRCGKDYFSRKS